MFEIGNRLEGVVDREKWAERGASFVAKVKATKVVWFPPKPVETGRKTAKAAKKTARKATKKTTGAARKTTGAAKKTSAARKATSGTKKVTRPIRAKKANGS